MEALADAVRLRALGFGSRMIDVLDRKIEFVLVSLRVGETGCRDRLNTRSNLMSSLKQRQNTVIEQIPAVIRGLAIIELHNPLLDCKSAINVC